MAKEKSIYSCQSCGYQSPKWMGKCPDCQSWNTLIEEKKEPELSVLETRTFDDIDTAPISITHIKSKDSDRITTHISELDRVLGGGLVHGSLVLVGGDPGIGKSTLVLQAFNAIAKKDIPVLYISGEESLEQTKLRADRLGAKSESLYLLSETLLEKVIKEAKKLKPKVLAIDSVQTLYTGELESAPGSISQVREVVARVMYLAKRENMTTVVMGHVTKEGALAGPRVLEHMVDTVLYFEGDGGKSYRILRAVKNRFGSTNEIGVFEMQEEGLIPVENPSELFLSERPLNASGSVVVSAVEGTRPMLVELQALVTPTILALPRRTTIGVDHNRVSLLVAVLEKKAELALYNHDIYVNVAGGLRIQETGVDLGIIASVASSFLNRSIESQVLFLGEVGLTGEVRAINHIEVRAKEASRLGFKKCFLPMSNLRKMKTKVPLEFIGISTVDELIQILFR